MGITSPPRKLQQMVIRDHETFAEYDTVTPMIQSRDLSNDETG